MTEWRKLGNAVKISSLIKSSNSRSNNIDEIVNTKPENIFGKVVDNAKIASKAIKPNPPFKREAWKKSSSITNTNLNKDIRIKEQYQTRKKPSSIKGIKTETSNQEVKGRKKQIVSKNPHVGLSDAQVPNSNKVTNKTQQKSILKRQTGSKQKTNNVKMNTTPKILSFTKNSKINQKGRGKRKRRTKDKSEEQEKENIVEISNQEETLEATVDEESQKVSEEGELSEEFKQWTLVSLVSSGNKESGTLDDEENPEVAQENLMGKARWKKLRLMLKFSKVTNHSILHMARHDDIMKGAISFNSTLPIIEMAKKYKLYRKELTGVIPRGGGKRESGSFDTMERYKQHKTEKRSNPLAESFIHTSNVEWSHYDGITQTRDPKGINSNIYIPWNKVVQEPLELQSQSISHNCSCYFGLLACNIRSASSVAIWIFARITRKLYKILTHVTIFNIAFLFGCYLGLITFLHIWVVNPLKKTLYMHGVMMRKISQACCSEWIASITHVWRLVFSGQKIDLSTLNTELSGVFIDKRHAPRCIEAKYKRGNIMSKTQKKYPYFKNALIPFGNPHRSKDMAKNQRQPDFFEEAFLLTNKKQKEYHPEIIESALRIAMAKREERFASGFLGTAKTFSNNILKSKEKKDQESTLGKIKDDIKQMFFGYTKPVEEGSLKPFEKSLQTEDVNIIKPIISGQDLWNKAKILSLMRAKRGVRNWTKARMKARAPRRKMNFWMQTKDIVFPKPKDEKLIKIL